MKERMWSSLRSSPELAFLRKVEHLSQQKVKVIQGHNFCHQNYNVNDSSEDITTLFD